MEGRKTFCKSFRAKIDMNKHLNSIEKMPYLVECLVEATGTIKQLLLANDSYNLGLNMLEDGLKNFQVLNLWSQLLPFQNLCTKKTI